MTERVEYFMLCGRISNCVGGPADKQCEHFTTVDVIVVFFSVSQHFGNIIRNVRTSTEIK